MSRNEIFDNVVGIVEQSEECLGHNKNRVKSIRRIYL